MRLVDASQITDEALIAYNSMMMECVEKVSHFAPLTLELWGDVLQELDKRSKARLFSGNYCDIGNARIENLY